VRNKQNKTKQRVESRFFRILVVFDTLVFVSFLNKRIASHYFQAGTKEFCRLFTIRISEYVFGQSTMAKVSFCMNGPLCTGFLIITAA
jgi:hypothetical protein